jgi:hypothetical protein
MKFFVSMLISLNAFATPIQIFHENNSLEANMFKDIMMLDYGIPEDLIIIKRANTCEDTKEEGKLGICIKNNGDLLLVSVDRGFVEESLKVFQAP